MAYSKQIKFSEEKEEALKLWLLYEINNHRAERSNWVQDLKSAQKEYWAKPNQAEKQFPFRGAANLVIPLIAIVAEATHARNMQRLYSLDQLTSLKFFDADWAPFDRDIERFADWQLLEQMKFKQKVESALLELEILGTGVIKSGYTRLVKNILTEQDGEVETVFYQGPEVYSVPLANFLMPFSATDPQTAPWCGEEHVSTQLDFKLGEQSGFYRQGTFDKLNTFYTPNNYVNLSSDPYRQEQEKEQSQEPVWPSRLGWYEIHCAFASDIKKKPVEIIVLYHYDSNTIMSIRANKDPLGRRPYRIGVYQKVANRWAGLGIAKQGDQFQKEITMQHRQRLDAGTLANANMMKVNKNAGFSPDEPVFPGKLWFVDSMDDIEPLQFGGTYPAAANNEQQSLYYYQQRSGIHDLNLGMAQVGTPGTATSDVARLQEGSTKHDYIHNNIVSWLSDVVQDLFCCIAQYGPSDPRYFDLIPNGNVVKAFFELDPSIIRSGILCQIRVATNSNNRLLDRNNWMQLAQIFQQYYTGIGAAAQVLGPQAMQVVAIHTIYSSSVALEKILESFDIPDKEKLTLKSLINGLLPQPTPPAGAGTGTERINENPTISGAPSFTQGPPQLSSGEVGPGAGPTSVSVG